MHLIERYIFRRTLTLSMMTLVSTTVMVLITQVLIFVNVLTASGQAIGTFFALAGTLVPAMVNVVMPFALHIGATQALNTMNSDSELAVIESAGGSPLLTARPILVLALLFSISSLMISLFLEPLAGRGQRDILSQASGDLISVAVQSGSFQQIRSRLYVQVSEQLPSGEFSGIMIVDYRDPKSELIYYARSGSIVKIGDVDVFALRDGEIQRKTVATGDLSTIRYASYVIDLKQFSVASATPSYHPAEQTTQYLLFGDRSDDYFSKYRPQEIRAELNRRFSDWLYPVALAMIAIFFASRASSNRQERIWSLTVGATIAISLRGVGFYFMNNSGGSDIYAALTFGVPIGTIVVFSALILSKKALRISTRYTDGVSSLFSRLLNLRSIVGVRS